MPRRASLSLAIVAALWGAPLGASVAQAQSPSPSAPPGADVARAEDQVVLSGTVNVPRGRSVGEVVVFHGRAIVAGVVAGDLVVLDGPVNVSGQVSGSVVAVNGPVRLASTASVGGDVLGGQHVRLEPGALVRGEVRDDVAFTPRGALAALGALLGAIAIAVSALLLLLVLLALAPRGLDRAASAIRTAPFASLAWGVVVAMALPIAAVVAAASILGLPLGLSLLLGFGLIALVGYACSVYAVGRLIVREPRGRAGASLAGWGVAAAVGLVPFLNVVTWFAGSVVGLGAVVVATWRARRVAPSRGRHRAGASWASDPPTRPAPAVPVTSHAPTGGDAAEEPTAESYPATADD